MIRYLCDPPPSCGGWFIVIVSVLLVLAGVVYNGGMIR